MLRRLTLATLFFAAFGAAHAQLPASVAQVMAQHGLPEDSVGVLVLKGDAVVLAHQADRPMQPASTMKLVTTLISLERLGPAFRGRTELRSTGEVVKGVLRGNLILKGGADADLSGEHLENMLRALHYQGIRRIEGDLVLDRSLFQPSRLDVGLPPFDESPEAYYNVIPDALLVNKNMLQLDMRSTAKALTLSMQPALDRVSIGSDMTLIEADCAKWEDGWKLPEAVRQKDGRIKVLLHGTFPKECARSYSINVLDRDDYIDRLFRQKWKELGGKFSGKVVEGVAPPESRVLAEHTSRMLPELVRDTNKPSDNLLARTLFLSLGSLQPDPAAGSFALAPNGETTFTRADAAVREWMRANRIDDTGFVIENGSGLSRAERITPQQMGHLLQAGLRSNWMPEFQASMPIAGIDGTLRRRLQGTPAAGRARLKTGTLRNVVALAGYVPDANGVQNVFVAMVNSEQASNGRGRAVVEALVDWVARSGVAPAAP
ncbi:D-alanyl-D-alanine carboxypeptidase/D-alanyl-D-alanine endopeptidase [Massilia yuzhufengensis]|uniref:D-alanyl-D-alanine carboxypeptidase / D-alanyl-D-alanine-endopeptidase (Penicillin-binding protein 4) n=1 Tax=Massilia yuzhufengensis TaxID=1164594 RepID=A0A1I1DCB3_9BURK|nr:D-alanyl-D-alanine carboxypeptidase/D-alanyl-D-alanine-endopeptidase [Massilia yuzhufengensis]SFB70173.1 D-alanyl-D-alanine carboxypeptidase / D-alanyl-D-alanine-endopeptidase (penicillin-binding protein 4) [Massilia yuzhufengensis]